MRTTRYQNGFTLIEVLLALVITGIIASAVATLAYAMNSAGLATDDTSQKQAQVRFATLRISDLVRNCRLVCYASPEDEELVVWAEDENGDKKINLGELTYIETGAAHDHLQLYTFTPFTGAESTEIKRDLIGALAANWWSPYGSLNQPTPLIPQCSNVQFGFSPELPPRSRFVTVSFDLLENQSTCHYQINATLRGWAGNLLDAGNNIVSDDD